MNQPASQPIDQSAAFDIESVDFTDPEQRQQRIRHISQLEDQITELAAHIHAATYRLLELIREYDACDGWSARDCIPAPTG